MRKDELKQTAQFKRYNRMHNYIARVPMYFCTRFDLSPTDVLVYAIIHNATSNMELKSFSGSIRGICAALNVTLPTVQKSLLKLEEKGFIRKETGNRNGKKWVCYVALVNYGAETPNQTYEDILRRNRVKNEDVSLSYTRGKLKRVGAVKIFSEGIE